MGLFDKLLHGADAIHDAKLDAEDAIFRDRSFERAERLAESGDSNSAVMFNGSAPATLRLGCAVLIATDDKAAVLDPGAMAGCIAASTKPGRKHRRIPEPGVDDQAQDMRTLKQLKKWTPERAVVESWTRCSALGMPSDNWDIVVRRTDGSVATIKRVEVPTYVRWFVHPGAELPIVVDPGESAKAQGDWPKLAVERAGGSWQDNPPAGSIAADRL